MHRGGFSKILLHSLNSPCDLLFAAEHSVGKTFYPTSTFNSPAANMLATQTSRRCATSRSSRVVPFAAQAPRRCVRLAAARNGQAEQASAVESLGKLSMPALASFVSFLAMDAPAMALEATNPFEGVQSNSLYVTLALFLMSVPGEPHKLAVAVQ